MRRWGGTVGGSVAASVALWLSRGTMAVSEARVDARLALPPPLWQLGLLIAVGIVAATVVGRGRVRLLPLVACVFLIVPWLPIPLPAGALAWSGPLAGLLWIAIAVSLLHLHVDRPDGSGAAVGPQATPGARSMPGRVAPASQAAIAAIVASVLYLGGSWSLRIVRPAGDEPHYLIIAQSLLRDGDLRIENNHGDRDYTDYWSTELKPDYLRRGTDGQIYSIHAPGLPVLIAPAFALGGYPGVVVFLALASAMASALVWWTAHLVSGSAPAAWFAWAAVSLTPPFFLLATAVFPDAPAAWCGLIVISALVRAEHGARSDRAAPPSLALCAAAGLALAALPWLHTRFAVTAALLGAVTAWRFRRLPRAGARLLALLAPAVISAAGWFAFFLAIYGTPNPAAPYGGMTQSELRFLWIGLPALLFDQQFGLLPYAPVLACAVAGWIALSRRPEARWIALALLLAVVPPIALGGAYRMWWGGFSPPARFAIPGVLVLSLPIAVAWHGARTAVGRTLGATALAVSLVVTLLIATVERGALSYNSRDGYATWLQWLSHLVSLPTGLPSYIRDPWAIVWSGTAIWLGLMLLAWVVLRQIERRVSRAAAIALTPSALALAVCFALAASWRLTGDEPLDPSRSQIDLLAAMRDRPVDRLLDLRTRRLLTGEAALARFDIPGQTRRGRVGLASTFVHFDELPAGTYRVRSQRLAPVTLDVHVGRPAGVRGYKPLTSVHLGGASGGPPTTFTLAVDGLDLRITGDDTAQALGQLSIQPLALRRQRPMTEAAPRAAGYGEAAVFFFNEAAYPEPTGFWVQGAATGRFAVHAPNGANGVTLFFRNGPFPNEVRVRAGDAEQTLALQPGEERTVVVPTGGRDAMGFEVFSSALFIPRRVDPASLDVRPLGVWVEVR